MAEGYLDRVNVEPAFVPVDMQSGDNNGAWISMVNYQTAIIILFKGAGTDGDDPIFKLQQADSSAGGNAKDLNFSIIHEKVGATVADVVSWTRQTQTAATSYVNTDSAQVEALIVVEVLAAELDQDNSFTHIRLEVANIGANAQIGCALYVRLDPRFAVKA